MRPPAAMKMRAGRRRRGAGYGLGIVDRDVAGKELGKHPQPDKKQPDHDQNISHEPALLSHFVVRAALCQVRIGIADKKSGETKQSQAPQI